MKFYTHGGRHHADEVFAAAIAELAFPSELEIIRLEDINDIPDDGIVADIGRVYDPMANKFDHHQEIIPRDDGYPYASAGLVWRTYGHAAIKQLLGTNENTTDFIHKYVDNALIKGIDAHDADNQYKVSSYSRAGSVKVMTLSEMMSKVFDDDFALAFRIAHLTMVKTIAAGYNLKRAQDTFEANHTKVTPHIIVLSEHVPWRTIVHNRYPDVLYVITPSSHPGSKYSMMATTITPDSRECRKPIERIRFDGFIHEGKWIAGHDELNKLIRLAKDNSDPELCTATPYDEAIQIAGPKFSVPQIEDVHFDSVAKTIDSQEKWDAWRARAEERFSHFTMKKTFNGVYDYWKPTCEAFSKWHSKLSEEKMNSM
jgi:uncharacterized UPF0160 family protein